MHQGFTGGLVGPLPSVLDEVEGDEGGIEEDPDSPAPSPVEAGIGVAGTLNEGGSTMVELEPAGAEGGLVGV